mgnify:CR=1 FL=1
MTTSSRKGMLPVRLGIEPDNKTALAGLNMDPSLADTMSDRQLDELVIQNEHNRIINWYNSQGRQKEGMKAAAEYKSKALENISKK